MTDLKVRLGKIEEAVGGLRNHQHLIMAVMGIIVLIMIYAIGRVDQLSDRIDQLSVRVAELPSQINTNLLNLTKTLADTITAAKLPPHK